MGSALSRFARIGFNHHLVTSHSVTLSRKCPDFSARAVHSCWTWSSWPCFWSCRGWAFSIWLVRYRQKYDLHKWMQIVMGVVLLLAVGAFEVDMRFFNDWEKLAEGSPYYVQGTWDAVWISLAIHLCFAVPTPLIWIFVIVRAMLQFPSPAAPSKHSAQHILWPASPPS